MTVKFEDLKLEVSNPDTKIVTINGQDIAVRQYLPVDDKLGLIGRVVMLAHDSDYNFANPLKIQVYLDLMMIMEYTNIEFPVDENGEVTNAPGLYDLLAQTMLPQLLEAIPYEERHTLERYAKRTIASVYDYQNSAMGILEQMNNNQTHMSDEITDLYHKLGDKDNLSLIRGILNNME